MRPGTWVDLLVAFDTLAFMLVSLRGGGGCTALGGRDNGDRHAIGITGNPLA